MAPVRNADISDRISCEVPEEFKIAKRRTGVSRTPRLIVGGRPFRRAVVFFGTKAWLAEERLGKSWIVVRPVPDLNDCES